MLKLNLNPNSHNIRMWRQRHVVNNVTFLSINADRIKFHFFIYPVHPGMRLTSPSLLEVSPLGVTLSLSELCMRDSRPGLWNVYSITCDWEKKIPSTLLGSSGPSIINIKQINRRKSNLTVYEGGSTKTVTPWTTQALEAYMPSWAKEWDEAWASKEMRLFTGQ